MDKFPDNLRDNRENYFTRTKKSWKNDISRWDLLIKANYCWTLEKMCFQVFHKRKSYNKSVSWKLNIITLVFHMSY